jgi:hypothetical protein
MRTEFLVRIGMAESTFSGISSAIGFMFIRLFSMSCFTVARKSGSHAMRTIVARTDATQKRGAANENGGTNGGKFWMVILENPAKMRVIDVHSSDPSPYAK